MPTQPYYYVTQQDIETYLNVSLTGNGQDTFTLLQQPLQDMVDSYTNRTWNFTNPVTDYFDAMHSVGTTYYSDYQFFISTPSISKTAFNNSYPLAGGINSITVGSLTVDPSYIVSYGSFVKVSASFSSVLLANPLGFRGVAITYNSDSEQNVPTPVKAALVQWMARMITTSNDSGKDAKEVMAGTIRQYFQEDKDNSMPDFVRFVLDRYRLTPIDRF